MKHRCAQCALLIEHDPNRYVTSAAKNSERECIFTGRSVGYLNLKTLGAAFPIHLGLRTDQLDLLNLTRVVLG